MTINTHDVPINMAALREAARYTETCYRGSYIELHYDTETHDVYYHFHASENNWTQYDDPAVIRVCGTRRHMTQQAIADAIHTALTQLVVAAVHDWLDHDIYNEYSDLRIDWDSASYDEDLGCMTMEARDADHTYTLTYVNGAIDINY